MIPELSVLDRDLSITSCSWMLIVLKVLSSKLCFGCFGQVFIGRVSLLILDSTNEEGCILFDRNNRWSGLLSLTHQLSISIYYLIHHSEQDKRFCAIRMFRLSNNAQNVFMIYLCLLFGILASAGLVSSVNFEGISGSTVYTEFRVYYPDSHLKGRAINLRGDNCNLTWSRGVLLEHSGPNEWSTALLCPQGLSVSVKALANDSWMMGGNVVFRGGSKIVEIFPSFNPQVNSILEKTKVHSTILGNSRTVGLYLPPSFYDNALKQYEVLFMQDGQNLFQDAQAAFGTAWHVQNTLNTLIGEGAIRQIILVGIWNTPDRINQYTYSSDSEYGGGKADKYLDFLEKEVIPLLKNSWLQGRTLGKWGIGGSSLGGLLSCYAAYTRPSLFTTAICMSSSFWWNEEDFDKKILQKGQFKGGVQFYLDSGDSGTSKDGKDETLSVYRHFQRMGYVQGQNLFYYLDKGGQHSEYFWGKRFKVPLTDLYS